MKNSILISLFTFAVFLSGCDTNTPERAIGFVTGENSDSQWHLGTQEAIDVVNTVDQLWKDQDYEGMRQYFADSVVVMRPNGLSTNTFDTSKVVLYPNPAANLLNIKGDFDTEESVTIFNMLGQTVLTKAVFSNDQSIDITSLAKGIYNVYFNNAKVSYKFIKE